MSTVESVRALDGAAPITGDDEWHALARRARLLATLSLAWLCFEGTATATAGFLAGSVALVGNGLDGAVEGLASMIVVWRFSGSRTHSAASEGRAQRLVAVSFFLLAPYIAVEATGALALEHHADTTWLGVGLSTATLCICPWLGRAKLRLGERSRQRLPPDPAVFACGVEQKIQTDGALASSTSIKSAPSLT